MGSLSGITSLVAPLLSFTGIPGALIGAGTSLVSQQLTRKQLQSQQDLALQQLQSRQRQEEDAAAQTAALQKSQMAAERQNAESRRIAALRRAVARQKTLFSAQGLGGANDGSNEAVLLGLYNDSNIDANEQARLDSLRSTALDQSLDQRKQRNLLEVTQLAERQNLSRILEGY